MRTGSLPVHSFVAVLIFACALRAPAQSDASGNWAGQTSVQHTDSNASASVGARWDHDVAMASDVSVANVKVTIDASKLRNIVAYRAFGIHTTVHDANLISPQVVALLNAAAINTLRYPGGAYADTYHWSNYQATAWQGE